MWTCRKCGRGETKMTKHGLRCLNCYNIWLRNYYHSNEQRRLNQQRSYLKRTYGITLQELEELLAAQRDCCAICKQHWTHCRKWRSSHYRGTFLENLSIDHDHATGRIRGLLCGQCNFAIGRLDDEPDRFMRAAAYLERGTATLSIDCLSAVAP